MVTFLFLFFVSSVEARDPAPSVPAVTLPQTPFFQNGPSGNFMMAQAQQAATVLSSCNAVQTPMNNLLNNMMTSPGGLGRSGGFGSTLSNSLGGMCPNLISLGTQCPGTSVVPTNTQMDCSTYSPASQQATEMMLNQALCSVQCKKGKYLAIQSEIGCLSAYASSIANLTSSLRNEFNNASQLIKQADNQYDAGLADRQAQLESQTEKLNEITGVEQELEASIPRNQTEVVAIKARLNSFNQMRNNLEESKKIRKAALTMQCFFTQPKPNQRCSQNGPPVSAAEYVKCRMNQSSLVTAQGVLQNSDALTKQSSAKVQALDALLNTIKAGAPTDPELPTTPEELAKYKPGKTRIMNTNDVKSQYYGALHSQFGPPYDAFILSAMQECENQSTLDVNSEVNRSGSNFGSMKLVVNNEENALVKDIQAENDALSRDIQRSYSALTNNSIPVNSGACMSADINTRVNCLTNEVNLKKSILSGGPGQGTEMVFRGSGGDATAQRIACNGLLDCQRKVKNSQTQTKSVMKQIEQAKKKFALDANQAYQSRAAQVAQMMGGTAQMFQSRVQALNQALADLGQQGLGLRPGRTEMIQKDAEGLPNPPQDMIAFLNGAGGISPPLPGPDAMANMQTSGVQGAAQNLDQNLSQIQGALNQIRTLASTCVSQRNQNLIDQLSRSLPGAGACYGTHYCEDGGKRNFDSAFNALSVLGAAPATFPSGGDMMTSLRSGIQTLCDNPYGQMNEEDSGLERQIIAKVREQRDLRTQLSKAEEKASGGNRFSKGKKSKVVSTPEIARLQGALDDVDEALRRLRSRQDAGQIGLNNARAGQVSSRASCFNFMNSLVMTPKMLQTVGPAGIQPIRSGFSR